MIRSPFTENRPWKTRSRVVKSHPELAENGEYLDIVAYRVAHWESRERFARQVESCNRAEIILKGLENHILGKLSSASDAGQPAASVDGPKPGNRFRWDGITHELTSVTWRLVEAMWGHASQHLDDIQDEVWGKTPPENMGSSVRNANKELKKIGYSKRISKVRKSDELVWKNAKNA